MNVIVYSKTKGFCGPCFATKRALTDAGIEFEILALEEQPAEVIEDLKTRVGMQAPIVITDTAAWSGFRPDLIDALTA
ncbi:glutaredoxin domain-containing protein [Herbiconiux sp. VKM Ac-2851]|uniref:glutaredoxin domain-containing protein n=1 Tax=Herbiconiux sp. VKM Ac-2851 TaxID=2739025 RepID=UPI00156403AE|nr:glutaredoxin domain-containing protein [Herbiconiux sp. VKM Ac-2851]NQX34724.1 NrdH-redoxin [Herbiconiux sp. VKM Ac-2851]